MKYELQFDLDTAENRLSATILTEELRMSYMEKLHVDPVNINNHCIEHPIILAEVMYHYEDADAEVARIEDEVKRAYAQLDTACRALLNSNNTKFTEKMVDAMVRDRKDYTEMLETLHAARRNAGRWKAMKEACHSQRYMLVQVASNYRAEGVSDITIKTQRVKEIVGG